MKYISPTEVCLKSAVSKEDCFRVLNALANMGIVKERLVCTCPGCHNILGEYDVINEVPNSFKCRRCGTETKEIFENTYIVFRTV
jgi:hypothetical protein